MQARIYTEQGREDKRAMKMSYVRKAFEHIPRKLRQAGQTQPGQVYPLSKRTLVSGRSVQNLAGLTAWLNSREKERKNEANEKLEDMSIYTHVKVFFLVMIWLSKPAFFGLWKTTQSPLITST